MFGYAVSESRLSIIAYHNLRRKMLVKSLNLFDHHTQCYIVEKLTHELVRTLRRLRLPAQHAISEYVLLRSE